MGKTIEELAKKSLKNISPYIPGKPIGELKRAFNLQRIIKLASNENPMGPSPKAVEAIKKKSQDIHRYPDGGAYYLKNALSRFLNVSPENLIMGSGSSEIISLFLQAFVKPDEEILIPYPSFLIYKILAHMIGAKPVEIKLKDDFSYDLNKFLDRITPATKVIIFCNPNNPTGTIIYRNQIEDFFKKVPDDILIISDEAYIEYVENKEFGSVFQYIAEKKNVLIARTFAKIYGLAGLRLGYGIAKKEIVQMMEKIRPPFNTTNLAQEAGLAALEDQDYVKKSYENNRLEKRYLYNEMDKLGISYIPTEANFILCKLKEDASSIVKELEKKGIIVRIMKAFGLPDNFVRITIGKREENRILIENLKELLK